MILTILYLKSSSFYREAKICYSTASVAQPDSTAPTALTSSNEYLPAFAKNAVKVFHNVLTQQKEINAFSKGKSAIYCFVNKQNGKFYVGSAKELRIRLKAYFSIARLERDNMNINKSILKYGHGNFAFLILEILKPEEDLISREQFWLDSLMPEYNICKIAGNRAGSKHSVETINKISLNNPKRIAVEILELATQVRTIFSSVRGAAKFISASPKTILYRESKGITQAFRGKYVITVNRTDR
jgi:hypothetical protein